MAGEKELGWSLSCDFEALRVMRKNLHLDTHVHRTLFSIVCWVLDWSISL